MDNANLLKAPGYELVNINLHYKTDLTSDYFRQLTAFFEVRNVFDTTYIASANNIANTVRRWRSKPWQRARRDPDRINLRRIAACVRRGNETCLPVI